MPVRPLSLLPLLVVVLAACGAEAGSTPVGSAAASPSDVGRPIAVPATHGEVTTRYPVTVLEGQGHGPELCLAGVEESYPPQCSGVPVDGWRWADVDQPPGHVQSARGVTWGLFLVSGTFDGTRLTLTHAGATAGIKAPPATSPTPSVSLPSGLDLETVRQDVENLPGVLAAMRDDRRVSLSVVYDDGSIQAWVDATYGAGVVEVDPALVDA